MNDNKIPPQVARGRRPPAIWLVLAAVLAVASYAGFTALQERTGGVDTADATDAELVALGRQIYDAQCASCHGETLKGQPNWRQRLPSGRLPAPPHDETGHTWHHPDTMLFEMTKYGVQKFGPPGYQTDMAPYVDILSDRQIWAALAFIKSTWPPRIRSRQKKIDRRFREN
ncbi:MAG TPA: cytochrome c [Rhodospirillales bacterium]|nr:cytochrome c [Rhodospirillales bacterium]